MAVAIDPKRGIPYVLNADRELDEGKRTTFYLLPLRQGQADILDKIASESVDDSRSSLLAKLALENLVGWDNLRDPVQGTVPFTAEAAREQLPLAFLLELGAAILREDSSADESEKN